VARVMRRSSVNDEDNASRDAVNWPTGQSMQTSEPAQEARSEDLTEDPEAQDLSIDPMLDSRDGAGLRPEPFDHDVSDEERRRMIAEAAYYIAESRDFRDGFELDDWLAAESEVNARLGSGSSH